MATIYNSDVTKELIRVGKLQINRDKIPGELAEKVVPVVEVNPALLRKVNWGKSVKSTTTGATAVLAAAENKQIYLTGATLGLAKNAACDIATGSLTIDVSIEGQTLNILGLPIATLTASSEAISVNFNPAIKIDKGSAIYQTSLTWTAGAASRYSSVVGYYVED